MAVSGTDGGLEIEEASTEAGAPVVCPEVSLDAGDSTNTLILDGGGRTYNLHILRGCDLTKPAPLVFAFHGGRAERGVLRGLHSHRAQSRRERLHPRRARRNHLHPGPLPRHARRVERWKLLRVAAQINTDVDDVGFVRAMIDTLSQQVCIDPKRIFATGFSNGGMLSTASRANCPTRSPRSPR